MAEGIKPKMAWGKTSNNMDELQQQPILSFVEIMEEQEKNEVKFQSFALYSVHFRRSYWRMLILLMMIVLEIIFWRSSYRVIQIVQLMNFLRQNCNVNLIGSWNYLKY